MAFDLIKYCLAAREQENGTDWFQILVFLMFVIFYAVSAWVQSQKKKQQTVAQDRKLDQTLAETPPKPRRQRPRVQLEPQKPVQPSFSAKPQIQAERIRQAYDFLNKPPKQKPVKLPHVKSVVAHKVAEPDKPTQNRLDSVISQAQGNELVKAVLYREILDKPIALRD